jgi:hypothetical protein
VSWTNAPIGGRDDVHEFGELVRVFSLALCGKHIVTQIVKVVAVSVIIVKENLHMAPVTLNVNGVRAGIGVNEAQMGVTLLFKTAVGSPALADHRSAGFDALHNVQQSLGSSIRNRFEKRPTGTAFHTTTYPLALNSVTPVVFPFTKLALICFNDLVRTADRNRVKFNIFEHGLSTVLPQSEIVAELKLRSSAIRLAGTVCTISC